MKISICVPQYNRIMYLLQSLDLIARQTYPDIEVVISDDCSTDDTEERLLALKGLYKYPMVYHRNEKNMGYDANYRKCIELANGEYCIVIGNDDSIFGDGSIAFLSRFLIDNNYPEIGFSNFVMAGDTTDVNKRARQTGVLGSGTKVAMKYYSSFSFVGGLVYKKEAFMRFNTAKHDGSIYAQMYLASVMIASGCRLFSIMEPLVVKDLVGDESERKSYRDVIASKWSNYKVENGGLPSVIHVLIEGFRDARVLNEKIIFNIFYRVYSVTFPYWVVDYKKNAGLPAAVGLIQGMDPFRVADFTLLNPFNKLRIYLSYLGSAAGGLLMPVALFAKIRNWLYNKVKK
ncbi:MAG: glycosyltransferase family 2 protein [Chitinophagaceae bacterium]